MVIARTALFAALVALVSGCPADAPDKGASSQVKPTAASKAGSATKPTPTSSLRTVSYKTTSESIAVGNLSARIKAQAERRAKGLKNPILAAQLIELYLLRAQMLGQMSDYDSAAAIGDAPFKDKGNKPTAADYLNRARTRSALHRFADAAADIDAAVAAGTSTASVKAMRLSIAIATGRPAEALAAREAAVDRAADYGSLAGLAAVKAALGQYQAADDLYLRALDAYKDVSPFAVAWIDFRRGVMWSEHAGDQSKGEQLYRAAIARLPSYLVANIHLAEIEAETGRLDAAINRLEKLNSPDVDPELPGVLAELLAERGEKERAAKLHKTAAARYDKLLKKHRAAFLDHGSEFFLATDAKRAARLAAENVAMRPTDRAYQLAIKTALAASMDKEACAYSRAAQNRKTMSQSLDALRAEAAQKCAAQP